MEHFISDIAFSPTVKKWQTDKGSRQAYARRDWQKELIPKLIDFIQESDSFYIASASKEGQPYIQHRGGPKGFLKVLDKETLAFVDFAGNQQYISAGNLSENQKVHLFLMDYPNRTRLKIWGTAQIIEDNQELLEDLFPKDYKAKPERIFLIKIVTWNLNCPQHITPRFTQEQLQPEIDRLKNRIQKLETQLEIH